MDTNFSVSREVKNGKPYALRKKLVAWKNQFQSITFKGVL